MNKKILYIFFLFSFLGARELVDKIVARVNGINVLHSDITRTRLDADSYTLEKVITQELYFQEAVKLKIIPSLIEVEKQIVSYKKDNKLMDLNDDEFEKYLKKQFKLTLNELKAEYTRHIAISRVLQNEIQSRVVVSKQEIENYYKNHPEYSDEQYKLETVIIPFNKAATEADALKVKNLEWVKHDDWIVKSNIADSMEFIFKMKKGDTSKPVKTEYGFQMVKLLDKKDSYKLSLDDRYVSIEEKIRTGKMNSFEDEFKKDLRNKATVVYL